MVIHILPVCAPFPRAPIHNDDDDSKDLDEEEVMPHPENREAETGGP